MGRAMSRYLVDSIEQHDGVTVRTHTELAAMGVTVSTAWRSRGARREDAPDRRVSVLIEAAPRTGGPAAIRGYFMTARPRDGLGPTWWPLEGDPLSSSPVSPAALTNHGLG
jgi:hypothetical protein